MSNATMSDAERIEYEASSLIDDAANMAVKLVQSSDELEPLERLDAVAGLLDALDTAKATIFELRRSLVEQYNPFLSYALMAEHLGCSKALIHQIVHDGEES